MRRFLTIGIKPNGSIAIIHGPEHPKRDHVEQFRKTVAASRKKSEFAEIHVIDLSRGVIKKRRFGRVKFKGDTGSGKRTIARSVKHKKPRAAKAKKAAKKTAKKAPRKSAKPPKTDAKSPASESSAAPPADQKQ